MVENILDAAHRIQLTDEDRAYWDLRLRNGFIGVGARNNGWIKVDPPMPDYSSLTPEEINAAKNVRHEMGCDGQLDVDLTTGTIKTYNGQTRNVKPIVVEYLREATGWQDPNATSI